MNRQTSCEGNAHGTVSLMTPDEADEFALILKRPQMHLGESVQFSQMLGFICGVRYANSASHSYGFGSFGEFVREELSSVGDASIQWHEIVEQEFNQLELHVACSRLAKMFSAWAESERLRLKGGG